MKDRPKLEVGSYEAKTRLPELLRQVRDGYAVTITHRGRPIAALVPHGAAPNAAAAIDAYLAFCAGHPLTPVPALEAMTAAARK